MGPMPPSPPLRIVIVDDSPLVIEALRDALEEGGEMRVVGWACDGREAVERVERARPDLVTMDLAMPLMGGLEAVERIMARTPTRIVILTGGPCAKGSELVVEALARGALEVIPKGPLSPGTPAREALRARIKLLATVPLLASWRAVRRPVDSIRTGAPPTGDPAGLLGLVASTGGPALLGQILAALPSRLPAALLIVQHIADGFAGSLVAWLSRISSIPVVLATQGERPRPGVAYLAPTGAHLKVGRGGLSLTVDSQTPARDGHRPSGTLLLQSIADQCGPRGGGLVLTGMGRDGRDGLLQLRRAGGWTAAQDPASCVVDGMPRAAREAEAAAQVLTPAQMAEALCRVAHGWMARG
ncbi:MAG: chemotaxis protein CheB [Deltaproteobacteria bacterium]|nr:chemotaxis protein CheB [Deltaproteobacteria bacterium]